MIKDYGNGFSFNTETGEVATQMGTSPYKFWDAYRQEWPFGGKRSTSGQLFSTISFPRDESVELFLTWVKKQVPPFVTVEVFSLDIAGNAPRRTLDDTIVKEWQLRVALGEREYTSTVGAWMYYLMLMSEDRVKAWLQQSLREAGVLP